MFNFLRRWFDPLKNTTEAAQWMLEHGELCTFAGNRFESTEAALQFVESLYEAGADAVTIPNKCIRSEAWRLERERGPFADELLVKLPADPSKRQAVWRICEREYAEEYKEDWDPSPADYTPSKGVVYLRWS